MTQQAIGKAIEVSLTDTFEVNYSGGSHVSITPTKTLYANVVELLEDLRILAYEDDNDTFMYLGSDYRVIVSYTGGGSAVTTVTGELAVVLGFTGVAGEVVANLATATYRPDGLWIPRYHSSDPGYWTEIRGEAFAGQRSVAGRLSGISYEYRYERACAWPWETAVGALYHCYSGDTVEARSSFEHVINRSRDMVLTEDDSGGVPCKGVYYFDDLDDWVGWNSNYGDCAFGDGDPALRETDHNYVYCSASEASISRLSDDRHNGYYDVAVTLTTAAAPTWGAIADFS
jgi:hypothetical protein